MKNLPKLILMLAIVAISTSSCIKLDFTSDAQKANEELEGLWQLESFLVNDVALNIGDDPITITFNIDDSLPETGEMITRQSGTPEQRDEYVINEGGVTMTVNNETNRFEVSERRLTLWQTEMDASGVEIKLELILTR